MASAYEEGRARVRDIYHQDSACKLPWDDGLHNAVLKHLYRARLDEEQQSIALCIAWYRHNRATRQIPANILARRGIQDVFHGRDLPGLRGQCKGRGQRDALTIAEPIGEREHLAPSRIPNPAREAEGNELVALLLDGLEGPAKAIAQDLYESEDSVQAVCARHGLPRRKFYKMMHGK